MNNYMGMLQNMNNNMGIIPNMNNNMNMIPNMNNNIGMIPNMNMNNNMNIVPNMNMTMMPDINMEMQMQQQMMQQFMQQQNMQQQMMQQQALMQIQQMELNNPNPLSEKEKKEQEIQKNINNYYDSKKYEIDFKRIKNQITNFKKIIDILMIYIKHLEECIEKNNKIIDNYIGKPYKNKNYINLLNLSSSIEDIYEDKIKELELYNNDIKNIFKLGIKELKDNYLNDFNIKYNLNIKDLSDIGFRTYFYDKNKLDEVQFRELCRIDFKNIRRLELMFEDDIDINVLTKATFHNLSDLNLIGKIKDINILTKLPFKFLEILILSKNDFYNTNIDIFKNVVFTDLIELFLDNNKIRDIKPLKDFPFQKLKTLSLNNNLIDNLEILSETNFNNLEFLSLYNNKISDINVLSKVKFNGLIYLDLGCNQIKNIDILSQVPFINLKSLYLRDNLIENISVFINIPFINLSALKLTNNNIINFEILSNIPIKKGLSVYVNKGQYFKIKSEINNNIFINNCNINFISE